jgi:hypothetical protein
MAFSTLTCWRLHSSVCCVVQAQTAMVEYLLEHGAVIGFCDDYMSHCAKVLCAILYIMNCDCTAL